VPNSSGTSVTLGVDTHADVHVTVALDQLGRRLGTLAVPSTPAGYASLETWATGLGTIEQVLLRRLAARNQRRDANALTVTPEALDDFFARFEPPTDDEDAVT
jgi:hypothetical protein